LNSEGIEGGGNANAEFIKSCIQKSVQTLSGHGFPLKVVRQQHGVAMTVMAADSDQDRISVHPAMNLSLTWLVPANGLCDL
jgi:hypothetical protein